MNDWNEENIQVILHCERYKQLEKNDPLPFEIWLLSIWSSIILNLVNVCKVHETMNLT